MTFLKKHCQLAVAVALIAFLIFYGWRVISEHARVIDLGLFILLGVGILLIPVTDLAGQILSKLNEQASAGTNEATKAVDSVSGLNPRTHRQELELALVSRLRHSLAIVPEAGDNTKKMLDRLLVQDGSPIPSPDEQVAERALRQVLSVVQSYLPPDGISIHVAMSKIIALVDPFPVRSSASYTADPFQSQAVPSITLPVVDLGADALERKIQAKGLNAPRVTKDEIEAEIFSEHYFIGSDGIQQSNAVHVFSGASWYLGATQRMTFCAPQLKNGFTVIGESACVSRGNFDAQIGRDIARSNAIEKMWLLLGFRLADRLSLG